MIVKDIDRYIKGLYPPQLRMDGDPNGLLVGDPNQEVSNIMVSLNISEEVVDEAIVNGCELILSHHPLFFSPMRKIVKGEYYSDIVMKLIRNNISLISHHTNFDIGENGVSHSLANILSLKNLSPLREISKLKKGGFIENYKLVVFVPKGHQKSVKDAISNSGGGTIGDYDYCFFETDGVGSFRGGEETDPFIGKKGEIETVDELRIETIVPVWKLSTVITSMIKVHPYEEVAYDLIPLENSSSRYGLGVKGEFENGMKLEDVAKILKEVTGAKTFRVLKREGDPIIKSVAIVGGSGGKFVYDAIDNGIDLFISAELSHHTLLEAKEKIAVIDMTHHKSEKFAIKTLSDYLKDKFQHINVLISESDTDPITEI